MKRRSLQVLNLGSLGAIGAIVCSEMHTGKRPAPWCAVSMTPEFILIQHHTASLAFTASGEPVELSEINDEMLAEFQDAVLAEQVRGH